MSVGSRWDYLRVSWVVGEIGESAREAGLVKAVCVSGQEWVREGTRISEAVVDDIVHVYLRWMRLVKSV